MASDKMAGLKTYTTLQRLNIIIFDVTRNITCIQSFILMKELTEFCVFSYIFRRNLNVSAFGSRYCEICVFFSIPLNGLTHTHTLTHSRVDRE